MCVCVASVALALGCRSKTRKIGSRSMLFNMSTWDAPSNRTTCIVATLDSFGWHCCGASTFGRATLSFSTKENWKLLVFIVSVSNACLRWMNAVEDTHTHTHKHKAHIHIAFVSWCLARSCIVSFVELDTKHHELASAAWEPHSYTYIGSHFI